MRITPTPKCGLKLLQIRVRAQPLSLLYFNSTCKLIVPYYSNRNIRKNGCNRNVEKMIFEFVVSMNSKIGYQVQQVSNHTCHIILKFWFIPLNDIYLFLYLRLLLSNSIFYLGSFLWLKCQVWILFCSLNLAILCFYCLPRLFLTHCKVSKNSTHL